jgi:hypothetical protein
VLLVDAATALAVEAGAAGKDGTADTATFAPVSMRRASAVRIRGATSEAPGRCVIAGVRAVGCIAAFNSADSAGILAAAWVVATVAAIGGGKLAAVFGTLRAAYSENVPKAANASENSTVAFGETRGASARSSCGAW